MGDIDLVAAHADVSGLSPFDGRDVVRSTIMVTNAGDGLSAAMAVDPREYHHGQEVTLVIRGTVAKVRFDPLDTDSPEDSALVRVHSIKAGTAVILDEAGEKKVKGILDKTADRIKRAIEAARGIDRLPGVDDPPADDTEGDADGDGDITEPTPIR